MLHINLSTRPFYNDRAVRIGIAVLVILTAALTVFNASQILTLNARNAEFVGRGEDAEARAAELRQQAVLTRQTLDREELGAVQSAAREANLLIERRAFSWTDLFNRFEETLPADVRIGAVHPQIDAQGHMLVAVTVISRRAEDLATFIEQLEQTGAFRGVLTPQEEVQPDGTLRSVIQGYYGPQPGVPAVQPPPASDSDGAGRGNMPANAPSPAPIGPGTAR